MIAHCAPCEPRSVLNTRWVLCSESTDPPLSQRLVRVFNLALDCACVRMGFSEPQRTHNRGNFLKQMTRYSVTFPRVAHENTLARYTLRAAGPSQGSWLHGRGSSNASAGD